MLVEEMSRLPFGDEMVSMTHEDMKALIECLHLIWNTADMAAIPDVYSPQFVAH